jgi:hypothetical protein
MNPKAAAVLYARKRKAYDATPAQRSAGAFDVAVGELAGCSAAAVAVWRSKHNLWPKVDPALGAEEARRRAAYDAAPVALSPGLFDDALGKVCGCSGGAIFSWRRRRGLAPKVIRCTPAQILALKERVAAADIEIARLRALLLACGRCCAEADNALEAEEVVIALAG